MQLSTIFVPFKPQIRDTDFSVCAVLNGRRNIRSLMDHHSIRSESCSTGHNTTVTTNPPAQCSEHGRVVYPGKSLLKLGCALVAVCMLHACSPLLCTFASFVFPWCLLANFTTCVIPIKRSQIGVATICFDHAYA